MQYDYIDSDDQLQTFCSQLNGSKFIAFDTEFVSEDSYFPELCLVQVSTDDLLAVVDPQTIDDMTPFWSTLANPGHQTIVHAGREEFRFCQRACASRPAALFDIQMAAAFVGLDYPASYGKLISKLLSVNLKKGETRTDWRRRPLTDRQIEYALQDVTYLKPIYENIWSKIQNLNREDWFREEMESWQGNIEESDRRERWRRVSGITAVPDQSLVIVREVWRWRENEAMQRNRPPRRILRDDLIVELAKRGRSDVRQIRAIRGIEKSVSRKNLDAISQVIEDALQIPKSQRPKPIKPPSSQQANLLGQFISTALSSICRSVELAPSVVGTVQDVRELITYKLYPEQFSENELPQLAKGWRSHVIGQSIEDLLAGKTVIRIHDPKSSEPLAIEPFVQ